MLYRDLSTMIFVALHGESTRRRSQEIEFIEERLKKKNVKQDGAYGIIRQALKAIDLKIENDLPGEIANRTRPRPNIESHERTLSQSWIQGLDTRFDMVVAAAHDIRKTRVEDSGIDYKQDLRELRESILAEAEAMELDMSELEMVTIEEPDENSPLSLTKEA